MIGFLILLLFLVASVAACQRAQFAVGRTMLDVLGVVIGGGALCIPGAWLYIGGGVVDATGVGGGGAMLLGSLLMIIAIVTGPLLGLVVAERLQKKVLRFKRSYAFAFIGGLAFAIGIDCLSLLFAQNTDLFETLAMMLMVPATAAGAVAGYAVWRNRSESRWW